MPESVFDRITLTRNAYKIIGNRRNAFFDGSGVVSLPQPSFRLGNEDAVEVVFGDSTVPELPDNLEEPRKDGFMLQNRTGRMSEFPVSLDGIYMDAGARLYARWLGQHEYDDPEDLYVVVSSIR